MTFAVCVALDFLLPEDFAEPLTLSFWPTLMLYGGEMPLRRASSLTLVPVIREMRESVSPRFTV